MSDVPSQSKPDGMAEVKVVKPKKAAWGIAVADVRKKRQVAIGAVLAPIMEPALAKQGVLLAQILPHWRAICPLLAAHSCPEGVRGDTLTIAVASDGVKQELHYVTPQVIEGITRLLGYAAIAKVRAITRHDVGERVNGVTGNRIVVNTGGQKVAAATGADRDKATGMCKSIKDDDLRAALGRLGAEIMKTDSKNKG